MRICLLAAFCAAALAGQDPQWVAGVRALWKQVQAVPLGDSFEKGEVHGPWVKDNEKGRYKVEYSDGRVDFTDMPPPRSARVWAVLKRAAAATQYYTIGRNARYYTHYWMRASWIAEKGKWEIGPARENRGKSDDANWRAWQKKVGYGPHMKASRMSSWNHAHRYLVRDLSSLQTSREHVRKFVEGGYRAVQQGRAEATRKARERVKLSESIYEKGLAKMRDGLLVAGGNLGVGDAMWRCEEATLGLFQAAGKERLAKATYRMLSSRAKRKPEQAFEAERAEREWRAAGRQVSRLRRERRAAMADVMAGIR